jgi:hypothetical protein
VTRTSSLQIAFLACLVTLSYAAAEESRVAVKEVPLGLQRILKQLESGKSVPADSYNGVDIEE